VPGLGSFPEFLPPFSQVTLDPVEALPNHPFRFPLLLTLFAILSFRLWFAAPHGWPPRGYSSLFFDPFPDSSFLRSSSFSGVIPDSLSRRGVNDFFSGPPLFPSRSSPYIPSWFRPAQASLSLFRTWQPAAFFFSQHFHSGRLHLGALSHAYFLWNIFSFFLRLVLFPYVGPICPYQPSFADSTFAGGFFVFDFFWYFCFSRVDTRPP